MAPSILKTGPRQGSGTMLGKVKCHSKLNIHHFLRLCGIPMRLWPKFWLLNLYFRRALVDNKLVEWQNLVAQIAHVQLVDGSDTFRWNLTNSGSFTVRSFYLHLLDSQPPFRHKMIWKLKIPLKIKIFLWFLQRGILLTKDNLAKNNWTGSQKCCGCNSNETIQHLFLNCPYARLVWRIIFLLLV